MTFVYSSESIMRKYVHEFAIVVAAGYNKAKLQIHEPKEEFSMADISFEQRLAVLEAEVAQLKRDIKPASLQEPWWETIFGSFKDDPYYEEAMAEGRRYRESLRESDVE